MSTKIIRNLPWICTAFGPNVKTWQVSTPYKWATLTWRAEAPNAYQVRWGRYADGLPVDGPNECVCCATSVVAYVRMVNRNIGNNVDALPSGLRGTSMRTVEINRGVGT